MFQKLTLINRLLLFGIVAIVSSAVLLVVALDNLNSMNENFNKVVQGDATKVSLSKDIKSNLIEMHRAEKSIMLALTQDEMDEYRQNFDDAKREVDDKRAKLRELVDDENKKLLNNFRVNYERYVKTFNEIASLTRANSNQKAKELLRGEAREKSLLIDTLTDELRADIKKDINEEVSKANTDNATVKRKLRTLELIADIESGILKSTRDTGRTILLLTDKDIEDMANRSDKFLKETFEDMRELKKVTDTDRNIKIDRMLTALKDYDIVQTKVLNLTKQNSNQQALDLSSGVAKKLIVEARKYIFKIAAINDEQMDIASASSDERYSSSFNLLLIVFGLLFLFLMFLLSTIYKYLNLKLAKIDKKIEIIKSGQFIEEEEEEEVADELGNISVALGEAIAILKSNSKESKEQNWIKDSLVTLSSTLQEEEIASDITSKSISIISRTIDAGMGALYILDNEDKKLKLNATYSYINSNELSNEYAVGEGVVGQVALEMSPIKLNNIKKNDMTITTATTQEAPLNTYTYPLVYKGELLGVIELASYEIFDDIKQEYLNGSIDSLSAIIYASIQSDVTQTLLSQTQIQAEELEESSQRLTQQNEELEEQRQQMEEANRELEANKQELESQKSELELTQKEVQKRSDELEDSNKYKSEFLANMSHELRTPLNSINILSKIIEENKDGNLTGKQVKQAKTINQSGKDLLQLINDILDLSKIEAKMMSLNLSEVHLGALLNEVYSMFEPLVNEKDIKFTLTIDESLDKIVYTDKEKVRQVMKNFLSNALKFTNPQGSIAIEATLSDDKELPVKLSIVDSGIGIPSDKIETIFAAFKQADGSTSRNYGGTGLGLSISKELSGLLGGKIDVASKEGEGSTFSLLLPSRLNTDNIDEDLIDIIEQKKEAVIPNNTMIKQTSTIADDRNDLKKKDKTVLIIEDDEKFAQIVKDEANQIGLKAIVSLSGEDGFNLAKKYQPSGIVLDMHLPIMDGRDVLKLLKENIQTRHIPVKIISSDEPNIATKRMGAVEYMQKPVEPEQLENALKALIAKGDKTTKDLLIVKDDEVLRENLSQLLGMQDEDMNIVAVSNGAQAIEAVRKQQFDCAILDMGLPDMSGFKLLDIVKKHDCNLPVIVYTGREFSADELKTLREYSESIILKTAESEARLLDETMLFLHRVHTNLNDKQKALLHESLQTDSTFVNKKVLVVDDDMRNIFALSAVLEDKGMQLVTASNGQEAINELNSHEDIDIVLMDIMMPVMNGYEAMQAIREEQKHKDLPIIALTAKSQKEDRQKCLDGGASDYMSKPIDHDQLLQLMKVWLKKR